MSNKRKADDILAGGPEKMPKMYAAIREATWPAPPVDTYGWNTALPRDCKLHKSAVLAQYQLTYEDIEDFDYETKRRGDGYMHLYGEREIEWKAWEVHGGPDGLWHLLRLARKQHAHSGSRKPFPCPYEYTKGRPYDLDLRSPPCCDRYLAGNPIMFAAKADLPPWFWLECNVAIDRALYNGERPSGEPGSATRERLYAISAAQKFFHRHSARYSGCPARPLDLGHRLGPKPYALWTFRGLLQEAPTISATLRDTDASGPPRDRLLFHAASADCQWGRGYLEELFGKLCRLVKELGLEDDGWKSLRWEIYHKFASSVDGGLRYDGRRRYWTDPAGEWLEGRIESQFVPGTMRSQCADGYEYNKLLPVIGGTFRTPTPGSARGSSGTPSPNRAPVAGPSSA
ncbi:hypothetical protein K466DRAFT_602127 [Polyporus arcularius HHB13444]|uniref:Uncharacterized protein n=1 Tax=Polyporus arcularius HHB13444 TaxID=1314778 RepID=A0A5C3P4W2_9APHY|nr:hypothetical protein K466DRAFT_602127 [Polyporus arcularius HHB13444]